MKRPLLLSFTVLVITNLNIYGQFDSLNITKSSINDSARNHKVLHIGYGVQKKSNVMVAISSVSSNDTNLLHVQSLESALQGQVAGVLVVNEGAPGINPIVRIRGNGSIGNAATPLYVVDGIPITEVGAFNTFDIETMEILKDAGATAIYGSQGANGVVLITTKKGGQNSKLKISFDSYAGLQKIPKTLNLLNTDQYLEYGTTLYTNAGFPLPARFLNIDQPIYNGTSQTFAQTNTDWQGALFHKAMITNNNLSLCGGNRNSTFYASVGYFNQDGIMINTGYERYSLQINSEHKLAKWLKAGQTLMYSYGDRNNEKEQQGRSNILHALRDAPYLPIYNPWNIGGYQAAVVGIDGQDAHNPIEIQNLFSSTTGISKFLTTLFIEIKLANYLTFKSSFGYDFTKTASSILSPVFNDGFNSNTMETTTEEDLKHKSRFFINQLTFNRTWNNHNINTALIYENHRYSNDQSNTTIQGSGRSESGLSVTDKRPSYAGRLMYNFKEKYFINTSLRADQTSEVLSETKWTYFPAVSIGWRIDKEAFLAQNKLISQLKLRASHGKAGFGTETSSMTNIGMDLGLVKDVFTLSADWFNRVTNNLFLALYYYNYDPNIGYSAPGFTNMGKMTNKGLELQAAVQINAGGLKSSFSGNISFIRNNVDALYNNSPIDAGFNNGYGAFNITRTAVGQPIQSFYGWQTDGIFQNPTDVSNGHQLNAAPGDIRFKDISGPNGTPDNMIDSYDRTFLGSYLPKFTYGLMYSGSFKNLDWTVFFQGVYGNKIYNGTKVVTQGMNYLYNAGTEVMNAWTETNPHTNIPRAIMGDPNLNTRTSDRFIEDGSYLRLKTLSIGYTMPSKWSSFLKKHDIKIRIYLMAQNLLTFTKYTGYDPEVGSILSMDNGIPGQPRLLTNGVDYGFIPPARSFMAGIHIDF